MCAHPSLLRNVCPILLMFWKKEINRYLCKFRLVIIVENQLSLEASSNNRLLTSLKHAPKPYKHNKPSGCVRDYYLYSFFCIYLYFMYCPLYMHRFIIPYRY